MPTGSQPNVRAIRQPRTDVVAQRTRSLCGTAAIGSIAACPFCPEAGDMRSMPSLYPLSAMVIGAAAFCSLPAHAAWPDDVSLEALADDPGSTQDSRNAYSTVVRELGVAIANPSMGAARTSGMNGFDIQLVNSLAFIDARSGRASDPAPGNVFARMAMPPGPCGCRGERPQGPAARPRGRRALLLRGDESADGRRRVQSLGLVEGYRQAPDIVVQIGYSAYVGNDQIDLGVMDCSGASGTPRHRAEVGLNEGTFSLRRRWCVRHRCKPRTLPRSRKNSAFVRCPGSRAATPSRRATSLLPHTSDTASSPARSSCR